MNKIKTLSLFSGAGGLDIGFHQAGFEIVASVELEEKYCKTLLENKKHNKYVSSDLDVHNIDIRKFKPEEYANSGIKCIIGGPPCQTFSAAGRRAGGVIGTQDLRGQLYETYCNILDIIQPECFIFENVYGILGANNGEDWNEIKNAFRQYNYVLNYELIDAADYGVAQHRERVIMVGTKQKSFKFPLPTVGPESNTEKKLKSVFEAIKDIQKKDEEFSAGLGGLYGHLLPDVPEGLNYAYFTAEMGHPEPVFAWRSKFHDLLYKVNKDEPSRTIKASPGKFTGPFHWKNRHFTIPELKRIQSFPDDYQIVGSYSKVVEQIGNSVPPLLAYCLAISIKEQLFEDIEANELTFKVRPESFVSTFRKRQREKSKRFKEIAKHAIVQKYGNLTHYDESVSTKPTTEKFYVTRTDKFNRSTEPKKPKKIKSFSEVIITEAAQHIRMDLDEHSEQELSLKLEINITGLKKYLPRFDSLKLSANLSDLKEIFHCWKEVESALTKRSQFFTLIDIYGHYANRGDVVDITSKIVMHSKSNLAKVIEFFSQTANCGDITVLSDTAIHLGITDQELLDIVSIMRYMRFDIRTYETHPIIGKDNLLCTYPFPLLSPKALVQSKAVFNIRELEQTILI